MRATGEPPRPYPSTWAMDALLSDGGTVHLRPIRSDDAPAHRAFFARQSTESVYFRFFGPRVELSDAEVKRFTTVDYHDRMAFVALLGDDMIAVGRYDRLGSGTEAEVAFAVADAHQGRGIATLLLEYLAAYAADNGITRFSADTLLDNRSMLDVFSAAGFRRESQTIDYGVVHLAFDIEPTGASLEAIDARVDCRRAQHFANSPTPFRCSRRRGPRRVQHRAHRRSQPPQRRVQGSRLPHQPQRRDHRWTDVRAKHRGSRGACRSRRARCSG